jgi:hypothetical protein
MGGSLSKTKETTKTSPPAQPVAEQTTNPSYQNGAPVASSSAPPAVGASESHN